MDIRILASIADDFRQACEQHLAAHRSITVSLRSTMTKDETELYQLLERDRSVNPGESWPPEDKLAVTVLNLCDLFAKIVLRDREYPWGQEFDIAQHRLDTVSASFAKKGFPHLAKVFAPDQP